MRRSTSISVAETANAAQWPLPCRFDLLRTGLAHTIVGEVRWRHRHPDVEYTMFWIDT